MEKHESPLEIAKAPFEEILALPGVGEATMEKWMKEVGRWDEYQDWLAPIVVNGVEVSKKEIKSYGNLVATMKRLGFDPADPKYAGKDQSERSANVRRAFEQARMRGKVTDEDIARVVAEMKMRKVAKEEEKVEQRFEEVAGIRQENLLAIHDLIQENYNDLLRDYTATTSDAHQQLLHVAQLLVNRRLLQDTYTSITAESNNIETIGKNARTLGELNNQIRRMTDEINTILGGFKRQEDLVGGPQEYVTQTLTKGKEVMEVFALPVECDTCRTRYGVTVKFFPRDIIEFPVIDEVCQWEDPTTGKACSGRIYADIDQHLDDNKVVKFTHQEYFDPSVVGRDLLDEEAMGMASP